MNARMSDRRPRYTGMVDTRSPMVCVENAPERWENYNDVSSAMTEGWGWIDQNMIPSPIYMVPGNFGGGWDGYQQRKDKKRREKDYDSDESESSDGEKIKRKKKKVDKKKK